MHAIHELREMLCGELEEYGSKDSLTAQDLDVVDKLAHAVKNIDKILMTDVYSNKICSDYSIRRRDKIDPIEELTILMNEERDEAKRRRYQSIIQSIE